jgi:hypothetical protein
MIPQTRKKIAMALRLGKLCVTQVINTKNNDSEAHARHESSRRVWPWNNHCNAGKLALQS